MCKYYSWWKRTHFNTPEHIQAYKEMCLFGNRKMFVKSKHFTFNLDVNTSTNNIYTNECSLTYQISDICVLENLLTVVYMGKMQKRQRRYVKGNETCSSRWPLTFALWPKDWNWKGIFFSFVCRCVIWKCLFDRGSYNKGIGRSDRTAIERVQWDDFIYMSNKLCGTPGASCTNSNMF